MRSEPGICGSSVWVGTILSPRWGLSVSRFPHGLRRGLHSYGPFADKMRLPRVAEILVLRHTQQGLKPRFILAVRGTSELVPFPNSRASLPCG
jgi:hypothetical protein